MNELPMRFERGQFVHITVEGRTLDGMVTLASDNGESLIVMFDGMLDGHLGMMPLLWKDGGFVALMTGAPVLLKLQERSK